MSTTGPWLQGMVEGWIGAHPLSAMLVTSAYIQDVDDGSVPTAYEITGTGYSAGGIDVSGLLTVVYDSVFQEVRITCDAVTWPDLTSGDIGGIAFYSGSLLMSVDTFDPVEVSDRPFTYTPSNGGLIALAIGGESDG